MLKNGLKNYSLYFVMIVIIALTAMFEPLSSKWLQFDRGLINEGEIWRLLSAHWVHASFNHSLSNALGVLLLAYFAGSSLNNLQGVALVLFASSFVGICLYFFSTDLNFYVGLSGAQHGFLLVAPFISKHYSTRMAIVIALVIVAKTACEQTPFYDDMAAFEFIGARVAVDSHLFGCIAGALFLSFWLCLNKLKKDS